MTVILKIMTDQNILVLKVGTSTLAKNDARRGIVLDIDAFDRIAQQVLSLQSEGYGIVIVSSAAITAGMSHTNTATRPSKVSQMSELQRMASIGWRLILNTWAEAFAGKTIGELLITKRELDLTEERTELTGVIHQLLAHGDICIVNENDAITHDEIAFGDNDTLAAHLAVRLKQSSSQNSDVKLLLLSDIEGVYADKTDATTLIPIIKDIDAVRHVAKGADTTYGTGGMTTKFLAARIAQEAQVDTWIGKGKQEGIIDALLNGTAGTHFVQEIASQEVL
jgi:glutamate 5-kinase